jgi:hypothetical protein
MNSLEACIMTGAGKARSYYARMTDGYWLSHAPESFLQVLIALEIQKAGYAVYIDASIRKMKMDFDALPGRPASNLRTRPDIAVCHKHVSGLRAVIEIKRAWNLAPIQRDATKVARYLRQCGAPKVGYLLVYSEAKGKNRVDTLENRFRIWAHRISWQLLTLRTGVSEIDDWAWGMGLLRM